MPGFDSRPRIHYAARYGYWKNYSDYPEEDWLYEVQKGDTRRRYWEWVAKKIDEASGASKNMKAAKAKIL